MCLMCVYMLRVCVLCMCQLRVRVCWCVCECVCVCGGGTSLYSDSKMLYKLISVTRGWGGGRGWAHRCTLTPKCYIS